MNSDARDLKQSKTLQLRRGVDVNITWSSYLSLYRELLNVNKKMVGFSLLSFLLPLILFTIFFDLGFFITVFLSGFIGGPTAFIVSLLIDNNFEDKLDYSKSLKEQSDD